MKNKLHRTIQSLLESCLVVITWSPGLLYDFISLLYHCEGVLVLFFTTLIQFILRFVGIHLYTAQLSSDLATGIQRSSQSTATSQFWYHLSKGHCFRALAVCSDFTKLIHVAMFLLDTRGFLLQPFQAIHTCPVLLKYVWTYLKKGKILKQLHFCYCQTERNNQSEILFCSFYLLLSLLSFPSLFLPSFLSGISSNLPN